MRTTRFFGAMAALALLAGCGGGGGGGHESAGRGEVTGLVFDLQGKPVRDATVYVDANGRRETHTDASGAYVLADVSAVDVDVQASLNVGGTPYYGVNLGRVYRDESTPNVNIVLYPSSRIVALVGRVTTSGGRVLSNVRVVARPTDGAVLSSASGVTDSSGFYRIEGLAETVEYHVVASARGYGDDDAVVTVPTDPTTEERTQDLVVKNFTESAPDTPTGLFAQAFTSPGSPTTRGKARANAYEALKRLRNPKRAARTAKLKARDTALGSPIAIDLTWDEYPDRPAVRPNGFIVYRNETPAVDNGYLLDDPLATLFSDGDGGLSVGATYTYGLKAVATGYDVTSNVGRSALSATASAVPLGDLLVATPTGRTLSWAAVSGAANYSVYVYDAFPDLGVTPVYTTDTTGTTFTVPSSATPAGGTYYAIVVGARADDTAETFSDIVTVEP